MNLWVVVNPKKGLYNTYIYMAVCHFACQCRLRTQLHHSREGLHTYVTSPFRRYVNSRVSGWENITQHALLVSAPGSSCGRRRGQGWERRLKASSGSRLKISATREHWKITFGVRRVYIPSLHRVYIGFTYPTAHFGAQRDVQAHRQCAHLVYTPSLHT